MRTLALVLVFHAPLFACSCMKLPVCYTVERAPVIFTGEVIDGGIASLTDDPWFSNIKHARFRVIEAFRGLSRETKTVDVELHLWRGMCSPIPYHRGKRYLVTPEEREGVLFDGFCFSGEDVETAADKVRYVRDYFAGKMPANVHGRAATSRDTDPGLVDYLAMTGETKLLEGVRVTATRTRGSEEYSAVTDSSGKYFLTLPGPGSYFVHALLAPYRTQPARVISVSAHGCVIQDLALQVDNTIAGKVLNAKGEYIEHAKVSLIDFDSRGNRPLATAWVVGEGNYQFEHVPPGRYLLAVNAEGPEPGLPFETTYYPLASTRESAKIVEIQGDHSALTGLNLVVGAKVTFRQVTIKVAFVDGTPMKTASVLCTAQPGGPSTLSARWSHSEWSIGTGVVKFEAPTTFPLRIEVKDLYERDLGASYTAAFQAGSTPISHEFRVKP